MLENAQMQKVQMAEIIKKSLCKNKENCIDCECYITSSGYCTMTRKAFFAAEALFNAGFGDVKEYKKEMEYFRQACDDLLRQLDEVLGEEDE